VSTCLRAFGNNSIGTILVAALCQRYTRYNWQNLDPRLTKDTNNIELIDGSECDNGRSFFQDNFRPVKIYDYTDPDALVEVETAQISDTIDAEEGEFPFAYRDDLRHEGSLVYWTGVVFRLWARN